MSDQCCFVTSGSQFSKSYMEHIHGTIQEQKLLWAMAKELKKRREEIVIYERGGQSPYVILKAASHVQVLTLVCEDAGVLEDVEAMIKMVGDKEKCNG